MFDIFNKKNVITVMWVFLIVVAIFLAISNPRDRQEVDVWKGYDRASITTDARQYIDVVIADTPEKRTQGLSGTPSLESGLGMLFAFEQSGINSFWMKDMSYPIDIFWLDDEYQVVHTQRNVLPDTYPEIFGGGVMSRYTLETNIGELDDFTSITIHR